MKNTTNFIMSTLLILLVIGISPCYSQNSNSFYDNSETFTALKQSVLDAVYKYPKGEDLLTDNFKVLIANNFDSTIFSNALDTLKKYDNGNYSNYYIIIGLYSGERTFSTTIVRGFSSEKGKEVVYDVLHFAEDGIHVNNYIYNKEMVNDVFKKLNPLKFKDLPPSGDMFSMSIYKNGKFKTKLFKANQLTPEYHAKIKALFGN